jgi:hypothetical protein
MKSVYLFLAIVSLALVTSCKKEKVRETPDCIWTKITAFDSTYNCVEAKVDKYLFQGETVYVFDPGVCSQADMTSEVINQNCETLGYLGGLIGNTTINGENFSSAQFQETIWYK